MKTVRRLLYRDIASSVVFVAVAFLSLFFFIGFVDELDGVGTRGRTAWQALQASLLQLPRDFYELFPIAVLIGSIYSLARLAQGSEFTILRTGGLGPARALRLLAVLGLAFAVLTFVIGDFVAPAAQRLAVRLKAQQNGGFSAGAEGAWLKEKRSTPEGERSFSVNVAGADAQGRLTGVRIFEFDADGRLRSRIEAQKAQVGDEADAAGATSAGATSAGATSAGAPAAAETASVWTLYGVQRADWPMARSEGVSSISLSTHERLSWPSTLTAQVVSAAVLPVDTMTTLELWRYAAHLNDQAQASQTHQIRFWRKALYPLACLVMVALALPFAYLHARSGGVSLKVFGGVMLGISFVLLSNLSGHLGMLGGWSPWVAAASPSIFYLMLSMGAFAWLVRYR